MVSIAASISAIALGAGGAEAAQMWDSSNIKDHSLRSRDFSPEAKAALKGAKGLTGATGSQGVRGDAGAPGQTGASGPTGPGGPTGPRGPQGPAGPKGVVEYVKDTLTIPAGPNAFGAFPVITCPADTSIITGSGIATAGPSNQYPLPGYPDLTHNGWVFMYGNDGPTHDAEVMVVCG